MPRGIKEIALAQVNIGEMPGQIATASVGGDHDHPKVSKSGRGEWSFIVIGITLIIWITRISCISKGAKHLILNPKGWNIKYKKKPIYPLWGRRSWKKSLDVQNQRWEQRSVLRTRPPTWTRELAAVPTRKAVPAEGAAAGSKGHGLTGACPKVQILMCMCKPYANHVLARLRLWCQVAPIGVGEVIGCQLVLLF